MSLSSLSSSWLRSSDRGAAKMSFNQLPKLREVEKAAEAGASQKVVVAVRASKEISRTAIVWALKHVVQPGDCIVFLVLLPNQSPGRKFWAFPRFSGDCASGQRKSTSVAASGQKSDVSDLCSRMMLQLRDVYDPNKVNVKIKVVSDSPCGIVAAESKQALANWVVLDRDLKHEEKCCMEELQCNIVVMKRSQPKVLRLKLVGSSGRVSKAPILTHTDSDKPGGKSSTCIKESVSLVRAPAITPNSSPELGTPSASTDAGTSSASMSSSELGASPLSASDMNNGTKKETIFKHEIRQQQLSVGSVSDGEGSSPSRSSDLQPWMVDILSRRGPVKPAVHSFESRIRTTDILLERISELDTAPNISSMRSMSDLSFRGNVRDMVSLSRSTPPRPPPLCSICQHRAPVFGKPPRWFSYAELELATGGFSQANFLAEGGFGSVHRGILLDGQAVAVKQYKLASSQGDNEFCSEVEVLSCAQHRNVVMLIGFCVEERRRLLVYEYICNGSLDSHLYNQCGEPLGWSARQKIAVGAARGLRYLHEECRVGCIIHRDMRPNNILVTHDFEPLVGDFGLARWQPDGDLGVETRVIGTFGYLAPEYAQSGQITEKADVYSFGIVLVELVTGRKAVDISQPKGQQFLSEWARPLLEERAIDELIDPRLAGRLCKNEVARMLHAASLCISRDPNERPRMSHVLRILEGDLFDMTLIAAPNHDPRNAKSPYEALRSSMDRDREQQSCSNRC